MTRNPVRLRTRAKVFLRMPDSKWKHIICEMQKYIVLVGSYFLREKDIVLICGIQENQSIFFAWMTLIYFTRTLI